MQHTAIYVCISIFCEIFQFLQVVSAPTWATFEPLNLPSNNAIIDENGSSISSTCIPGTVSYPGGEFVCCGSREGDDGGHGGCVYARGAEADQITTYQYKALDLDPRPFTDWWTTNMHLSIPDKALVAGTCPFNGEDLHVCRAFNDSGTLIIGWTTKTTKFCIIPNGGVGYAAKKYDVAVAVRNPNVYYDTTTEESVVQHYTTTDNETRLTSYGGDISDNEGDCTTSFISGIIVGATVALIVGVILALGFCYCKSIFSFVHTRLQQDKTDNI